MSLLRAEAATSKSRYDGIFLGSVLAITVLGTLAVWSAASPLPYYSQILQRHFFALCLGILSFLFGASFNYQIFEDQAKTVYGIVIAVLVAVLVIGVNLRGHKSWIRLPFFTFQPVELARIGLVLVLAAYIDHRAGKLGNVREITGAFAILLPITVLVLLQPDLSSAMIMFPSFVLMLFVGGAAISHLLVITVYGGLAVALPMVWALLDIYPALVKQSRLAAFIHSLAGFHWPLFATVVGFFLLAFLLWRLMGMMRVQASWIPFAMGALVVTLALCSGVVVNRHMQKRQYQRQRFFAFLAPEVDPQGASYNVNQALVAIGSGGVLGKGIFGGTQSQLGFLPERHTDFIFAVIGEEMGFIGAMSVLILYLTMIWRIINTARLARDRYGFLVCCGLATMFGFYLLINVGMCLGLLPVAGLPLPLVSYGGSALVITLWALGIVANVHSKRYAFV